MDRQLQSPLGAYRFAGRRKPYGSTDPHDFLAAENISAVDRQTAAIFRAVEQLVDYPEMGRPGRVADTRELVMQGSPYIVAYGRIDDSICILALLYGGRGPSNF